MDCVYYELPLKKEPCKSCERHGAWVDKREAAPEKKKPNNTMETARTILEMLAYIATIASAIYQMLKG